MAPASEKERNEGSFRSTSKTLYGERKSMRGRRPGAEGTETRRARSRSLEAAAQRQSTEATPPHTSYDRAPHAARGAGRAGFLT